jgi:hypothetical protein
VRNAAGTAMGTLTLSTASGVLTVRSADAAGTTLFERGLTGTSNSTVDALDPTLSFRDLIASAGSNFNLTLTPSGTLSNNQYVIAATQLVTGGTATIGSSGLTQAYSAILSSGALVFTANNERLPDQRFVLEHGAVLLIQDDGVTMRVPPTFHVTQSANQTRVTWTVPGLTGDTTSVSATQQASLTLEPANVRASVSGLAANLTIDLPTNYPAAWKTWLDHEFLLAGMVNGTHYTTTISSNTTLHIVIVGPQAGTQDVYAVLQLATVQLTARSSG